MELFTPYLILLGQVIFGGYWLYNGINHFRNFSGMVAYTKGKGVPMPTLAYTISSLLILFAGASILLGVYTEWASLALVLFLVPVTFYMHAYWTLSGEARMTDMIMFMKNVALLGASLLLLAIPVPWMWSAW